MSHYKNAEADVSIYRNGTPVNSGGDKSPRYADEISITLINIRNNNFYGKIFYTVNY